MSDIGLKILGKYGGSSFEYRTNFHRKNVKKRPKAFKSVIQFFKKIDA